MDKTEWEFLRKFDRKLTYVAKICSEVESNSESLASLQSEVADMKLVVAEFRRILHMRKQIRKVLFWLTTVIVTAGISAFIEVRTNLYLPAREEGTIAPSKVESPYGRVE